MPTAKEILEGIRAEVAAEGHAKTASAGVNLDELSDDHLKEVANRFGQKAEKRAAVSKLVAEGEALKNNTTDANTFLTRAHKLAWHQALKTAGFRPGMTPLHLIDRTPAVKLAQEGTKAAVTLLAAAFTGAIDPRGFLEDYNGVVEGDPQE